MAKFKEYTEKLTERLSGLLSRGGRSDEVHSYEKISSVNSRSMLNSSNSRKKASAGDSSLIRAFLCLLLVVVFFAVFVGRLFNWQIVHGEEFKEAPVASVSYSVSSDATRGEILDVNGKELAVNRTTFNIVINRIYVEDENLNDVIITLVNIMAQNDAAYIDELPISVMGEGFVLDEGSGGDVEYIESPAMLDKEGLTADEIMAGLAERYDAGYLQDPYLRRAVISVRYNMEKRGFSYEQVYVFAEKVKTDIVALVTEKTQTIPCVEIRTGNERVIKNGTVIPHILGVVGSLSEEEYEENKDKGYALDDEIGKFGVEAGLESYLRGSAGEKTITKDENGNILDEVETVEAKPGNTVYLTIDSRIQEVTNYSLMMNIKAAQAEGLSAVAAAKASNARQQSKLGEDCVAGGAVMLDLRDFSVIAASSYPSYDISKYYDPDYQTALLNNKNSPLFDRAFHGVFSPGSSYKPCVALAALQEKIITPNTSINCTMHYDYYKNYPVNCMHYHGSISLHDAISQSCNYYFAEVGRRTGISTMYMYSEKFGLGVKTGLEVNESTGVLAGRDSMTWYEGNTVQAAIGQSDNTFTPVQLATYVATVANNGKRYQTHLVRQITNYQRDEVVLYNDPEKPTLVADAGISDKNLKEVQSAMREVVTQGTASSYAGKYSIAIAGKTGTAENAGSDHVTFICYAPYKNPEVAVAVVLEHGAKGKYAQYVAMDMLDAYFKDKTLEQVKKSRWK